jgi:hypothetical protein
MLKGSRREMVREENPLAFTFAPDPLLPLADIKFLSLLIDATVCLTTSHAMTSAAELTSMRDVPHRMTILTLDWAASTVRAPSTHSMSRSLRDLQQTPG